jgi:hypothetical protein
MDYFFKEKEIPQKKICLTLHVSIDKNFRTHMDSNSTTIHRFKMQVNKFSGTISKGMNKTKRRLVKELVYGIQASKDVKLSNISRALKETIPLIKTEDRLSRNLGSEDLTEEINNQLMRLGDDKIDDTMVIAIDPGDLMKPYAKAMENLCKIYDGSEHEPASGYHMCQVTAANIAHDKIVPLYCEAYSSEADDYPGKTEKLIEIIKKVKERIGSKGTWAIDREGDDIDLIRFFTDEHLEFVARLTKKRYLHFGGNKFRQVKAERIHHHVPLNFTANICITHEGKEEDLQLKYGAVTVALPEYPDQWYTLVIIEGFGKDPMRLLTTKKVNIQNNQELWNIVEIYLTRWKCDECYRYIKQSYNLEDFRVMSYSSIRNLTVLVHAIAYFTSIYMGISLKLKVMVNKIFILSKRFFGVPTFFNYAMADGIFELLKVSKIGINTDYIGKTGPPHQSFQLSLFPD